ncbi:MAG TPA: ABC transporter permease [Vicinamibacterales bacterium]|nr:ABC transporter permease [Vicinamibacterales bacterium]
MTLLHRLASIVRWIARRDRAEHDLHEELQVFIDMAAADEVRGGATAAEARRRAAIALGGLEPAKERVRGGRHGAWLDAAGRDIRYGLRQLRLSPAFSAIAIATLALSIGGITAIFSAFDTILLRPLPYADPDRLVMVWDDMSKSEGDSRFFSTPAEWTEWRRLNTVITDLACSQSGTAILSGDGEPEEVRARRVTWNLWSVLGVQPALGRVFTEDEDDKGARVVVMSHGLWQRRFGGASDIVGRKISVNDEAYEVVGVMPRSFYFMPSRDIDMWMPASFPPGLRGNFTWHSAQIVARLKPGITLEHARQSMSALSLRVTAKDFRGPHAVTMIPLREEMAGKTGTALIILLWAAAALLLIGCVNLANLLLSRGEGRGREVAVRAALGAGRGRLIAQFLTESLVLAGLGAVAGLALAVPAMRFLERLVPEAMGAARLTLDWRVLAFATVATVTAALASGLAPAWRGARISSQDGLRDGGRGTAGARSHWFQHSLIAVETALAVALLTCGGLLLQTFQHLRNIDLGIRTERLLTFETPLLRYKDFDRRVAFVNAELEKVRAIPGVTNAGAISQIPLTITDNYRFYLRAGQPPNRFSEQIALTRVVSHGYFTAIGARLREGRFFETSDRRSESPAVVVNESFANRNYPGRSPLGKRLKFERLNETGYWYTIVGVVKEIRERGVAEDTRPAIYRVHEQADQANDSPSGIVVRTAVDPASIISAVRQAIWTVDGNQPLARIRTMEDIVDRQLSTPTQSTGLLGAFALLALSLASIGMYGVLSYAVIQRTNEIGVRMALGATSGEILLSFGRRGLGLTLCGLALGLGLSVIASRLLTALLYGFHPDYIATVAAVSVILTAVATLAWFVPARRASLVDPIIALRQE